MTQRTYVVILGLLGFALVVTPTAAVGIERHEVVWPTDEGGNGHVYGLTPPGCWSNAEAFAVGLGAHLVTIDDAAENEFLRTTFLNISGEQEDLWIGLLSPTGDVVDEATWGWSSGSPSDYRNWRPGQPDDQWPATPNDRYAAMNFPLADDGRWDNYPNCWWRSPRGIYEIEQRETLPAPDFDSGWRRCTPSNGWEAAVTIRHDLDTHLEQLTIKTLFRRKRFSFGQSGYEVGILIEPRNVLMRGRNAVALVPGCDRSMIHYRVQIWTHR